MAPSWEESVSPARGPRPQEAGEASTDLQTGVHFTQRDRRRVCSEPRFGQLVLSRGSSFYSVLGRGLGVQSSSYRSCSDGHGGTSQLPTVKLTGSERVSTYVCVHVCVCACMLVCGCLGEGSDAQAQRGHAD